jgi:hypothetical protein
LTCGEGGREERFSYLFSYEASMGRMYVFMYFGKLEQVIRSGKLRERIGLDELGGGLYGGCSQARRRRAETRMGGVWQLLRPNDWREDLLDVVEYQSYSHEKI